MHSSLPSFFCSSPHSCTVDRFFDFVTYFPCDVVWIFPKNTHTLFWVLSSSLLATNYLLSLANNWWHQSEPERERESETKNCSLLWAVTEDEKLGKFSAKRENSVPQTNTHSHSDTRAHVKNNRFPRKTGARVLDQSPFSSLLRLRLGVFGAVRVVLPEFEL